MKFDTKIAVIIREDLPVWQKLNVTAFTISGIVAANEGLVGENYEDASGNRYLPMVRQPMLMFAGSAEEIERPISGPWNGMSLLLFLQKSCFRLPMMRKTGPLLKWQAVIILI